MKQAPKTIVPVLDRSDWLKTVAIFFVVVDHFGYFFVEEAGWWSALGRFAAPVFFFLLGYAETRKVPFRWLTLGFALTLLDSWNNEWTWVAPNILLSLAWIRVTRPFVKRWVLRFGWPGSIALVAGLCLLLPLTGDLVDYGSEGWLWSFFGLCQRLYVDAGRDERTERMRLFVGWFAAFVGVCCEQLEFSFSDPQLATVCFGLLVLTLVLTRFQRGPSSMQPSEMVARVIYFVGWHTLEIYSFQLAACEVIVAFFPELAV